MYFCVDGAHGRALHTVLPLASDLGLTVDTHCKQDKIKCVAKAVHSYKGPGNILIAWRHRHMGEIVEALGAEHIEYPDERYVACFYLCRLSVQAGRIVQGYLMDASAFGSQLLGT